MRHGNGFGAFARLGALAALVLAGTGFVPREKYLDLMERAVGAYTPEHMERYLRSVKQKGLAEHGFPRLCSNLGILLAHGRIPEKEEIFLRLMDTCCRQIPVAYPRNKFAVGNDFSVKEVCLCILELEKAKRVPQARIDAWRAHLGSIVPETTYSSRPPVGDKTARNWSVFGATSEQLRRFSGMGGDAAYVERYYGDQLRFFDENGMYRDPHQPMVYDFVTRLQYAVGLTCGYDGPSRAKLEELMLKSAEPTLRMLSASGEIPFGGRSNQFLHNETFYAALCEYYAAWFHRRGDVRTARRFRAAAQRAVDSLAYWLDRPSIRHVKNRYPLETRYGTEGYGYFDKYMVTMGSWAYLGYYFADETVPEGPVEEPDAFTWSTGPDFHRTFVNAGGYTAQFDTAADERYDGSGLGRLQKRGAPPFICLSVPFAKAPSYTLDLTNETQLAILPGWKGTNGWNYAYGPVYRVIGSKAENGRARAVLSAARRGLAPLLWRNELSATGLEMAVTGSDDLALVLPAFEFDGERKSEVRIAKDGFTVAFDGWICRWETNGEIVDTGKVYGNRNGHYRRLEARSVAKGPLRVTISISKK